MISPEDLEKRIGGFALAAISLVLLLREDAWLGAWASELAAVRVQLEVSRPVPTRVPWMEQTLASNSDQVAFTRELTLQGYSKREQAAPLGPWIIPRLLQDRSALPNTHSMREPRNRPEATQHGPCNSQARARFLANYPGGRVKEDCWMLRNTGAAHNQGT